MRRKRSDGSRAGAGRNGAAIRMSPRTRVPLRRRSRPRVAAEAVPNREGTGSGEGAGAEKKSTDGRRSFSYEPSTSEAPAMERNYNALRCGRSILRRGGASGGSKAERNNHGISESALSKPSDSGPPSADRESRYVAVQLL